MHCAVANGQRGRKRQPDGGLRGLGAISRSELCRGGNHHGAAVVHPLCHAAVASETATPMKLSQTCSTSALPNPEAPLSGVPEKAADDEQGHAASR